MNLLLHICCAPCAIYPLKVLQDKGHQVTGYFYNPNIHPFYEYRKRLDILLDYAEKVNLPLMISEDYPLEDYMRAVVFRESSRCGPCYHLRLDRTAQIAREGGFDGFTSTLFYSKFQDHFAVKEIAETLSREKGPLFYYLDFRVGWKEGIARSRELKMYRQQYCGCLFSERERYMGQRSKNKNPLGSTGA